MSKLTLRRAERIKLFLYEYYLGHLLWTNTVRIIGGPLTIALGVQFYHKSERFAVAYGGFCFFYGIYYLLKPLLIIAARPLLFKSISFNLSLTESGLKWQESGDETTVQFSSFEKIARQTIYYSLKLPGKTTIYLPVEQLSEEEKAALINQLTA